MSMEFTLNDLQRRRVEDHLALVEQVLRRSIKTNETVDGMGHDDLYQEGCIALCRASVSYELIAVLYTHKPTEFQFTNYCIRPAGIISSSSRHDLLLYDWAEYQAGADPY